MSDDFKQRCDDFRDIEEAGCVAALEKAKAVKPEANGAELLHEVSWALMSGSWRLALTLNPDVSHDEIKKNWLKLATEFADNNSTLPEEN